MSDLSNHPDLSLCRSLYKLDCKNLWRRASLAYDNPFIIFESIISFKASNSLINALSKLYLLIFFIY